MRAEFDSGHGWSDEAPTTPWHPRAPRARFVPALAAPKAPLPMAARHLHRVQNANAYAAPTSFLKTPRSIAIPPELARPVRPPPPVAPSFAPPALVARDARRRPHWPIRIFLLCIVVAAEIAFAYHARFFRARHEAPSAAVPVTAAPPAPPEPVPAPAPTPTATETASPTPVLPAGMGLLRTTDAKPGHRIFVNQRIVGQTPQAVLVRCGAAIVKLGSGGRAHAVDVPCGEAIDVADR